MDVVEEDTRGWDQGVFVPLALAFPAANLPVIELSVLGTLDPEVRSTSDGLAPGDSFEAPSVDFLGHISARGFQNTGQAAGRWGGRLSLAEPECLHATCTLMLVGLFAWCLLWSHCEHRLLREAVIHVISSGPCHRRCPRVKALPALARIVLQEPWALGSCRRIRQVCAHSKRVLA
jgi:hypothetical protein